MTDSQLPPAQATGRGVAHAATAPDPAAYVADHLDGLYRYACLRVGPEDAEDVTQQAFQALFQAYESGRPPDDAGAWLFTVVRRRIADLHRRRVRRPAIALPAGWEGLCEAPLPNEALAQRELVELVHAALGALPALPRALLLAHYRGGQSLAALGRAHGLSTKAVEMRLRRARAAFRSHYLSLGATLGASEGRHDARPRSHPGARPAPRPARRRSGR